MLSGLSNHYEGHTATEHGLWSLLIDPVGWRADRLVETDELPANPIDCQGSAGTCR